MDGYIGAVILLVFSAFLVYMSYIMDQSERKEKMFKYMIDHGIRPVPRDEDEAYLPDGMSWGTKQNIIDIEPTNAKAIRKKKRK